MDNYNQTLNTNPQEIPPVKPSNNLPLSIVSTILGCCSPFCIGFIVGIVAIVFSAQVDGKYRMGDYVGAESTAKNARILSYIALGLAVLGIIINAVRIATGGMDEFTEQYRQLLEQYQ